MATIAERILLINEKSGGNMSEMARKLNVTPAYISKLKKNLDDIPSDRILNDICDIYGVNKEWLVNGVGDMYAPEDKAKTIAKIANRLMHDEDSFRLKLVAALSDLDEKQLDLIKNIAEKLVEDNIEQ